MGNGILTSIVATWALISYYTASADSLLYIALIQLSAELYVNSMLVTLNSRGKVREMFIDARREQATPLKELLPTAR
ncbi:hypothetical protein E4T56_gene13633, partial [Termitomyces sp. T112]